MLTLSVNKVKRTAVLVVTPCDTASVHRSDTWYYFADFYPKVPSHTGKWALKPGDLLGSVKFFESLVLIYKFILLFALHFTIILFNILTLSGTASDENYL